MRSLSLLVVLLSVLSSCPHNLASATAIARHSDASRKSYYSRSHSLGESYIFDSREWQSVNVTDLDYKYNEPRLAKRASSSSSAQGGTVSHLVNDAWNGLKGIGSALGVEITWYTGQDLLNPSCWKNPSWHPTDDSMACALTAVGWTSAPKCFSFLELCNGSKKCVFVRVVDSCAGCAAGSKHVDLTKTAFSQLVDLDQGVLNVQMRPATEPDAWFDELWGPQN